MFGYRKRSANIGRSFVRRGCRRCRLVLSIGKFEHTRVVWVVGLVAKTTEGSLRVASPTISRTRPQQVPQHPSLELYGRRQSSIDYFTTNAKYPSSTTSIIRQNVSIMLSGYLLSRGSNSDVGVTPVVFVQVLDMRSLATSVRRV